MRPRAEAHDLHPRRLHGLLRTDPGHAGPALGLVVIGAFLLTFLVAVAYRLSR